jgi:hypothetical protein
MPVNQFTTAPIQLSDTASMEREFGRWIDVLRLYGIRRGKLYQLLKTGEIKSVSLRRRGQKHSCRLIYLPSVREYLHRLMEEQAGSGIGDQSSASTE